jgi:hypothetical protein
MKIESAMLGLPFRPEWLTTAKKCYPQLES